MSAQAKEDVKASTGAALGEASVFEVQSSGFRVQGSGFRVQGSGFRVQGSGFRVQDSGFRVQGSGFRVDALGDTREKQRADERILLQARLFVLREKKIKLPPFLNLNCHHVLT